MKTHAAMAVLASPEANPVHGLTRRTIPKGVKPSASINSTALPFLSNLRATPLQIFMKFHVFHG